MLAGCSVTGPTVGEERPAVVLSPDGWDGVSPLPLVVALHGYGNSGSQITRWTGLDDADGAHVVLPDGLVDARNFRFWNATTECCDYDETGVDDVGYVLGLVDAVAEAFPVDPQRIGLLGHSNGGFLGYSLLCQPDHPFSALVSIAGAGEWDAELCQATRPVSVLQVHGTADRAQAIEGDPTGPGAEEMLSRWGERAGCDAPLVATGTRDYTPARPGEETVVEAKEGCTAGIDVGLWRMVGATHSPQFNSAFQDDVLAWMLAQSRLGSE